MRLCHRKFDSTQSTLTGIAEHYSKTVSGSASPKDLLLGQEHFTPLTGMFE